MIKHKESPVMKNGIILPKGYTFLSCVLLLIFLIIVPVSLQAQTDSGEKLYVKLSQIANGKGDIKVFEVLNEQSTTIDWNKATKMAFAGNLRVLKLVTEKKPEAKHTLYLVRKLSGELFVLALPEDPSMISKDADSPYAGLEGMMESKLEFEVDVVKTTIDGQDYEFARFVARPSPVMLDRIFKIFIILMLFFVMVGMGLTLTLEEFALVFKKPKGIIIGEILQFGVMPFLAFVLGYLVGFYEYFPFIYVGMILITATPGGVTSNLMTYYAKGDVALSISLTSFSTVFSLIFTPLLLALYCTNLPEVTIPVKIVVQTILILVILPLAIGMSVRKKWDGFAKKAVPVFSALGIVALLILIIAGVLSNLNSFADTARYGVKFYGTIFSLTLLGMLVGLFISKLVGINNYQTRAISLETGLRNASLAMTIALLIQDAMGDFYSSLFFTSAIFGLVMYLAGVISLFLFKPFLPIPVKEE